jgi:hypothetical protein
MITVYVIWQQNPLFRKENILSFHRIKKQAELIASTNKSTRIEEHIIMPDDIKRIREIRLFVAKNALHDIKNLSKQIKCEPEDMIILRAEIIKRIKECEEKLDAEFIYDDEIQKYLDGIAMGIE